MNDCPEWCTGVHVGESNVHQSEQIDAGGVVVHATDAPNESPLVWIDHGSEYISVSPVQAAGLAVALARVLELVDLEAAR